MGGQIGRAGWGDKAGERAEGVGLRFCVPATPDEGICIRQWDWSETSQTVSIFTKNLGLVRAIAKGSKRPKAAFSGGIELLTRGRLGILLKPTTELGTLTEWDLLQTFPALRTSLRAHQAGLYAADLVHHALQPHDPHPVLYEALVGVLTHLGTTAEGEPRAWVEVGLVRLQWAVLVETGYRPVLERDVATGGRLDEEAAAYRFDPELGGVRGDVDGESGWRVRAETIRALAGVVTGNAEEVDAGTLERCNRLLASYLRHLLGVEPKTMPVLFGTRLPR